jgi:predicted RNase H-like nuclease
MAGRKWVAGVDGAQKGWVVAYVPLRKGQGTHLERYEHFSDLKAVIESMNCLAAAVDMPMGLSDEPNNEIDQELRKRLGERRSSLFPTPSTGVLKANTYEEALKLNREITGKGISIQAWNLVPQIRQVRQVIRPSDTDKFLECHPESSFAAMTLTALQSKKTDEGVRQRMELLLEFIPDLHNVLDELPKKCKIDDALDACAAAWTAKRYVRGKSLILGGDDYDKDGYPVRVII